MRILVTNDDGLDCEGIHELAAAMTRHGEVVIVAPDEDYSGSGASLGAIHLITPEVRRVDVDGIDEAWTVSGPPALCIMFARLGAFGHVDLVASGINPGANVGRSVYHSGTVGAALTARTGHITGIAVSQTVPDFGVEGQAEGSGEEGQEWATAAQVASTVVERLIASPPAEASVLNINVPNLPLDRVKGWRWTEIGVKPPRAMSRVDLVPVDGEDGTFTAEMNWGDAVELPVDTDAGAVMADEVALSWLSPIAALDPTPLPRLDDAMEGLLS